MSTHEAVQTILQKLPPGVSLHEVAREIEFIAGVREGFSQLDRGEGTPLEEVAQQHAVEIGEQTVQRVGSNQTLKVDVRVVAATNKNLEAMVREEFFYQM